MKTTKANNPERSGSAAGCKIADSVGALLKKARTDLGCSRREAATRMKIPERYIAFFEDGAYDKMPEDIYSKIYLKVYCKFLGLDSPTMVNLYRQERSRYVAGQKSVAEPATRHPARAVPASALVTTPHLLRNIFLGLLAASLLVYLGWAVQNIVAAPAISLSSPTEGLMTSDSEIWVEGRTEREITLRINGKYVAPDDNGNFRDKLTLQDGWNEIRVVGAKKHSKEAVITRRVFVSTPAEALVQPTEQLTADLR
ncbi:MAG: helix-turn-helix domain-containing protein [Patescibacteria group bacterium]|jgi:cytoskeletal protein RodZ